MAKSTQRVPPVEPLPPLSHLLSTKTVSPQSLLTDKDITKPRDLYTFLSLGYLPVNTLQWPQHGISGANTEEKRGKISLSTITTSSKQWEDPLSQPSYVHFDAHNPVTGLPVLPLPAITRVSSASCYDDGDKDDSLFEENRAPRKSIINEEDHKINISTTYIFAPTERLHETVKYKRNVTIPKIKPKKSHSTSTDIVQHEAPVKSQKTSHTSSKTSFTENFASCPRKADRDMHPGNSLFGVRPECLFMNTQLGERNPLLRHTTKDNPSQQQLVPKAGQGLNDLKDYAEYPDAYWKLRDGTITQPEDLEADMIDRDLYRLRQISTLKLNTIERTFQVTQDPFRKWRGKAGEPVFSPRQQQRNRLRKEKTKLTDIPVYPQHVLRPIPGVKPPHLNLRKKASDRKSDVTPLSTYRAAAESSRLNQQDAATSDAKELEIPFRISNEPTEESPAEATPRDMLAASLDTYRRLEEERDELVEDSNDLSIEKIHKLKCKKEKKAIKTSLVEVDLGSVDTYKRDHRAAPRRQLSEPLNGRSLNNSVNRESLVPTNPNSSMRSSKMDTARSLTLLNDKNRDECDNTNTAREEWEEKPDGQQTQRKGSETLATKHPIKAPVASILFRPQNELCVLDEDAGVGLVVAHLYNDNPRLEIVSPNVSDTFSVVKERLKNGNPPLKAVHLEVFAERRSPIKIPTGRTSYHPKLPSCRLDLVNYPPSNARQSCGGRSNSASFLDGRQTQLTRSTEASRQRLQSSEIRGEINRGANPSRSGTADNNNTTGVNIRFGGQGQVIVTASRESRRSR